MSPTSTTSGSISGIQAGFPLASSLLTVGYNPAVLEQAGVEVPSSDWTCSDWAAINRQRRLFDIFLKCQWQLADIT